MWRQTALIMVIIILPVALVSFFLKGSRTAAWTIYIALYVLVIPTAVWATRRCLKLDYGSFSITINENYGNKGVPWRIAARVWWAQFWRELLVLIAVCLLPGILLKGYLPSALLNNIVVSLLSALVGVWAVRRSLGLDYGSFSITIRENEKD